MRCIPKLAGVTGLLLLLGSTAEARPRKYAVINVGPADYATAQRLLSIYGVLSPAPAPVAARPAPRRAAPTAARPAPRRAEARDGARPAPRPERATPLSSGPIKGRALRRALAGLPHDEAAAMAASALLLGKRLYSTLHRAEAAEAFARAIAFYDGHVVWKQARPALIEASTYLLLCHHSQGNKDAARDVAARLRELTGNKSPKGMPVSTWDAYPLQPLPLTPRRQLEVKAPAKARVLLDDQTVGRGPQVLHVGPSAHRVRVELAGHRVFHAQVPAGPTGQQILVSLVPRTTDAFADIRKELAAVRRSAQRWNVEALKSLAKRLFIDHLLVCVLEGGSLKARWFSRRLGKFVPSELSLPRPGKGELRGPVFAAFGKLSKAERERAAALAERDKKGDKPKKKEPKLWKKWYFWVAAALVAGVVAAFAIKDSLDEEKVILRVTRE